MSFSRRDISLLLPGLLAAQAAAAEKNAASILPSKCYEFSELPVKTNPETHGESRQVFRGEMMADLEIACHMTKLAPGAMPHPPHKHVNDILLPEGTVEITVEGKSRRIGPGSVAFIASNELHGAKNVGDVPVQYFILELDGQKT